MAVALSRVTPAVVQRLVPVQVLLYADCLFCGISCRLAASAAACQLVGMVLMLTLILCRVIPLVGCVRRALAAGRDVAILFLPWWQW